MRPGEATKKLRTAGEKEKKTRCYKSINFQERISPHQPDELPVRPMLSRARVTGASVKVSTYTRDLLEAIPELLKTT